MIHILSHVMRKCSHKFCLSYFQNYLNSLLNDVNGTVNEIIPSWIPENIKKYKGDKIQIKLLCGADLLESFAIKGLWADDDVSNNLKIMFFFRSKTDVLINDLRLNIFFSSKGF